ncbi:MAG: phosphatase PAP2 family protein [Candidatus Melainabacteria bacterium]|nr:phosphatase PAP2 family protein [Candidatus Melainabacteria bacterium]
MAEGELTAIDNFILASLRDPNNPSKILGPAWLLWFMQEISHLGGVYAMSAITVISSVFFAIKKRFRTLLLFVLSISGGSLIMLLMKHFFNRPRPSVVPHLAEFTLGSYPSGHSMVSAIVYLTLGVLLARSTKSLKMRFVYLQTAGLLTFLIGISRCFLGVHYPSDVLAGWCAGVLWAALSYLLARFVLRK